MIKAVHKKRFEKLCNGLNSLMTEISLYNDDAHYYLANDWLNLMDGKTHNDKLEALYDNVSINVRINKADGGDW